VEAAQGPGLDESAPASKAERVHPDSCLAQACVQADSADEAVSPPAAAGRRSPVPVAQGSESDESAGQVPQAGSNSGSAERGYVPADSPTEQDLSAGFRDVIADLLPQADSVHRDSYPAQACVRADSPAAEDWQAGSCRFDGLLDCRSEQEYPAFSPEPAPHAAAET
jgi:hypothetical protein